MSKPNGLGRGVWCIYESPLPWAGQAGSVGGEVRCTSVVFVGIHAGVGIGSGFMAGLQHCLA